MTAAEKVIEKLEQVVPMRFTCFPNSEDICSPLLASNAMDALCRAAREESDVEDSDWCDRDGMRIARGLSLVSFLAATLAAVTRAAMAYRAAQDAADALPPTLYSDGRGGVSEALGLIEVTRRELFTALDVFEVVASAEAMGL